MNFDNRSLFISVESSGINYKDNFLEYTIYAYVVDKCLSDNDESLIIMIQENVFVLSQLQDFILQSLDVDFEKIMVAQAPNTDYTQTAAFCSFTISMDKTISGADCDNLNLE